MRPPTQKSFFSHQRKIGKAPEGFLGNGNFSVMTLAYRKSCCFNPSAMRNYHYRSVGSLFDTVKPH